MSCVLHYTSIRLRTFEFGHLELTGVAPEFVEEMVKHRQSPQHETPLALQGAEKTRRQVRLGRGEADTLPPVCICCGNEATEWIAKTYRGRLNAELSGSSAMGILSFAVLGIGWISWNRLPDPWHVRLPVCRRHRGYWGWRYFLMFALFLLLVGAIWLAIYLDRGSAGWVCLGGFVGFLVWAGVAIYLQETMIQPVEVTDATLALKFVSERFVEAVDQRRRRGGPA
jgi:hypothetical protein